MLWCGLLSSSQGPNVELERVCGEVLVRGFVAHLTVELLYRNPADKALEVSYVCPVDVKAAVYSFEAKLEGRTITAHCLEKKKAKEAYTNAVKQGHTAILGSENECSGDLIHLSLGNLPSGETANLKLKMVMELSVGVGGDVTFTLPTVFNPRYCPEFKTQPDFFARPNQSTPIKTPYVFDVKGEVRGTYKIAKVISHSDPINVNITDDDTVAKITQDGGSTRDHDWGFQIYYQTVHVPHALQMKGDRSCKGLMKDDVLMLNIFPEVPLQGHSPHNELIFVVDRSGSMEGTKIQRSKSTLLFILKSLPPGCRFNIISFGSRFSSLFDGSSERYTEETLQKALTLQKSMQADMGGTEIFTALKHVYSNDLIPGYPRQVIVLTDGEVWNLGQIFELVSRHANDTRVFSVGIGDGASSALVKGIAEAGRGRYEMVIHEKELQTKVMGLVASMLQENITNLKVECDITPTQSLALVPKIPPYIFGGQHLILYARVTSNAEVRSVKVAWRIGGKEMTSEIKERDCAIIHDSNFSFHRLAAKTQLKQWEKETDELDDEEMIELSVSSGVVCKATALVGIDQDRKVFKEEPFNPAMGIFGQPLGGRLFSPHSFWGDTIAFGSAPPSNFTRFGTFGGYNARESNLVGGPLFGSSGGSGGGQLFNTPSNAAKPEPFSSVSAMSTAGDGSAFGSNNSSLFGSLPQSLSSGSGQLFGKQSNAAKPVPFSSTFFSNPDSDMSAFGSNNSSTFGSPPQSEGEKLLCVQFNAAKPVLFSSASSTSPAREGMAFRCKNPTVFGLTPESGGSGGGQLFGTQSNSAKPVPFSNVSSMSPAGDEAAIRYNNPIMFGFTPQSGGSGGGQLFGTQSNAAKPELFSSVSSMSIASDGSAFGSNNSSLFGSLSQSLSSGSEQLFGKQSNAAKPVPFSSTCTSTFGSPSQSGGGQLLCVQSNAAKPVLFSNASSTSPATDGMAFRCKNPTVFGFTPQSGGSGGGQLFGAQSNAAKPMPSSSVSSTSPAGNGAAFGSNNPIMFGCAPQSGGGPLFGAQSNPAKPVPFSSVPSMSPAGDGAAIRCNNPIMFGFTPQSGGGRSFGAQSNADKPVPFNSASSTNPASDGSAFRCNNPIMFGFTPQSGGSGSEQVFCAQSNVTKSMQFSSVSFPSSAGVGATFGSNNPITVQSGGGFNEQSRCTSSTFSFGAIPPDNMKTFFKSHQPAMKAKTFSLSTMQDATNKNQEWHGTEEEIQDRLFYLVSAQNFDGSWNIEHCKWVISNLEEQHLNSIQLEVTLDDTCLATAILLSFLETEFVTRKQEWEFVSIKARKFLEAKSVDIAGVLELFSKFLEKYIHKDIK